MDSSSMDAKPARFQRPTRIDGQTYIEFVNKCRLENRQIRETLERLIILYNKKGESVFDSGKKKK
jgi:hypothetical protein